MAGRSAPTMRIAISPIFQTFLATTRPHENDVAGNWVFRHSLVVVALFYRFSPSIPTASPFRTSSTAVSGLYPSLFMVWR